MKIRYKTNKDKIQLKIQCLCFCCKCNPSFQHNPQKSSQDPKWSQEGDSETKAVQAQFMFFKHAYLIAI